MYYLTVLLILGFVVLVHEAGHLLAGLKVGIPIKRFSIGYGPKLFEYNWKGVAYRLSLIPIGGYVMPEMQDTDEFFTIPVGKRLIFALGGPLANFLCTVIAFTFFNIIQGGFGFYRLLVLPWQQAGHFIWDMVKSLGMIFATGQVSGIVGIVSEGGQFISGGILHIIFFVIVLNVNLAVLNLLPIPALDGGHIVLGLLEKVWPKINRFRVALALASWVLLLGIMLYATSMDIWRLFV